MVTKKLPEVKKEKLLRPKCVRKKNERPKLVRQKLLDAKTGRNMNYWGLQCKKKNI